MADPYRIPQTPDPTVQPDHAAGRRVLRPLLWTVLIVSAAANGVSSITGLPALVGIGFGVVTLGCVAALVVHHYRHRR
ncbi:hypothetical protein [Plantactinospora sp. BC1]|uniref:hypothetical protein n=1 Tax=Plantactinospora sp. BC1 TaxID=2108470 RepID=UPI0018FE5309|nr:hypothetical protein [Plantactinospora sp. BC1]